MPKLHFTCTRRSSDCLRGSFGRTFASCCWRIAGVAVDSSRQTRLDSKPERRNHGEEDVRRVEAMQSLCAFGGSPEKPRPLAQPKRTYAVIIYRINGETRMRERAIGRLVEGEREYSLRACSRPRQPHKFSMSTSAFCCAMQIIASLSTNWSCAHTYLEIPCARACARSQSDADKMLKIATQMCNERVNV